jgi:hypothetical protein
MSVDHKLVKFRPVLTLAQLQDIANMARENEANSSYPEASSILKVIVPMIAKVEVGAINPAYKISEIALQKTKDKNDRERYENGLMSSEEEMEYESKILGV